MPERRPPAEVVGEPASLEMDASYVEPTTGETIEYRARNVLPGAVVSVFAGIVSGLLGIGGGVVNVPTMNVLMGVPIRVATATSTYMLGATAAAGALLYLSRGQIDGTAGRVRRRRRIPWRRRRCAILETGSASDAQCAIRDRRRDLCRPDAAAVRDRMKPPALTVRALRAGSAFALALFLSSIVLDLLGNDIAERAALLGIVAIIATPAMSLLATAVEQWSRDRQTAVARSFRDRRPGRGDRAGAVHRP